MTRAHNNHIKLGMVAGLTAAMLLVSGCGNKAEADKGESDPKDSKEGISEKTEVRSVEKSPEPTEKVSKKIEAVTGNHSKLVWYQYLGKSADPLGNGGQHQLWGIDTQDGLGVRVILEKKSSYTRPLISPDGKWIFYTNKHVERKGDKKISKPVVHRVDWKGEQAEELGKGYAVDVWEDPKTKITWVYVANLVPTNRASMYADKLERFQLEDPKKRELVWKKTKISVDSIQLSKDGKRASCLFPWPDVGVMDLEKNEYWRNQHGCWPSLAPDNSYTAWVFDGSHKSLHIFADRGKKLSVVKINDGPGMDGHEMYHPRWANHPRFITVTGPYKGPSIGKSGKNAEVYIGKFSEKIDAVENWVQVTKNKKGDHYPDLWIKGGEKAALGDIGGAKNAAADSKAGLAKSWPSNRKGLLFLWENADAQNQIGNGKSQRMCGVEARQRARFGRHFEMLTGGGYFELDAASAKAIDGKMREGDFTIQLRFTATTQKQAGTILSYESFQLRQEESGGLILAVKEGSFSLGKVKEGAPVHLTVSFQGGKWTVLRGGKVLKIEAVKNSEAGGFSVAGFVLGDSKWEGEVEGLAVYGRGLTAEEVAKDSAYFSSVSKTRKAAHRVKLQGKLVGMTAVRGVEELDTYRRALLVYTYEVEKVIEGDFDEKTVHVNHWSILDRKPLSGIPRKLGQSYTLEIEPMSEHPELLSERRWSDGFALEEYFDVTTPAP